MTIILLIANFWTEYTPLMGSYILSFVGDAAMAAILTQRTVTYKVEVLYKRVKLNSRGDQ